MIQRDLERVNRTQDDISRLPDDGKITVTIPKKPRSRKTPPPFAFWSTIADLKHMVAVINKELEDKTREATQSRSEMHDAKRNKDVINRRHRIAVDALATLQGSLEGLPLAYLNEMIAKMEAVEL